MADYSTMSAFSFEVSEGNEVLEKQFMYICGLMEALEDGQELEPHDWEEISKFVDKEDAEYLTWGWDAEGYDGDTRKIRCWGDESLNINVMAKVVQEMLRRMRSEEKVVIGWACVCSKMRSDGFGGGACVITQDVIHMQDSYGWVEGIISTLL